MRLQCQEFATSLLDHARTSHELEIMLNFNGSEVDEYWEPGERQTLERLKLAIRYKQKKVRHSLESAILSSHIKPFSPVRGPSECPTIVGCHLVRRAARIPSQRNGGPDNASGPIRHDVSGVQHDLHDCTVIGSGKVYEETVRQVHLPFGQLRLLLT